MKNKLLTKYKKIYHQRVDKVTVKAYLMILKKDDIGWLELSKYFGVNNQEELLLFLKENI